MVFDQILKINSTLLLSDKKEALDVVENKIVETLNKVRINTEETGLKVKIHDPVEEWSFYKTPNHLIKGITLDCAYLGGKVKLCDEHKRYFWAAINSINRLIFSRNFLRDFKFT